MDEKDVAEYFNMAETRDGNQLMFLEGQRVWRLHPDAGGDHELFLFACAVKEGAAGNVLGGNAFTTMISGGWSAPRSISFGRGRTP
jgi:hypothetical protein